MLKKNIGTIRKKAIKYYQSEDMNKKIINNKKLKKQKELQEQKQLEELKEYKRLKQLEEAKAINECNKLKELNANGNIIKKFETEDNIENNEKFDSIFENLNNKTNRADIEFKEPYNNESERKEWVNKRIKTPNVDLKRLGVEFCYDPEFEMEVIIIASQMCQMKLLDFDILQATPSGTDCIILKNSEKAFLEFEESLCNFFMHNHNHNGIDYILCWDVNEKDLKRQSEAYVKRYSGYIESIRYNESKGECTFINCDGTNHNIKLYILSEMIKEL